MWLIVLTSESHTAEYIAERLVELARTFQVEEKVQGMVYDNAYNFTL